MSTVLQPSMCVSHIFTTVHNLHTCCCRCDICPSAVTITWTALTMVNVSLGTLKTSFQADFLDAEGVQNHDGMDIDNDKDNELHVKMKV